MKAIRRYSFILLLAFSCMKGFATEGLHDTIRPPRPKVGIVLGGGGAKGAAHIGVLKYIEEIGLPVDYVVGTSMGSIIGGLYALGYTPDELQNLISNLDWSKYMSNNVARTDISSADKRRRSTYLFTIPFNSGELLTKLRNRQIEDNYLDETRATPTSFIASLPSSFISGADLLNLFNSLCIGYQSPIDFNELPIPFACIATNITTGEAVVLRKGKFPEAIRASMAIPGVFSPVTIDGQLLVDGGLVNNFPTDICREMGADIIIGIEVASGMITDPKRLQSLPQLASQIKNIMVKGNTVENRKLCNLYIHPEVDDFNMLSFSPAAIDTIVKRGYNHAATFREQLLTIKKELSKYDAGGKILQAPKAQLISGDSLQLESIVMNNVNDKEFKWLFRKSQLKLDQPIPKSDLERAINIFKGAGIFSSIQYWLTPSQPFTTPLGDNKYTLHFKFLRSEPHSFSVGLNYNSEESAALIVNLGLGQNKFSGWKYNLTGRLGLNTKINNTLTWAGLSLANFNLSYDFQRARYNSVHSKQSESLTFSRNRIRFFISEFHLRNILTHVGFEADWISNTNSTWGPYAKLSFDNMDHANFATKGLEAHFEFHERFSKAAPTPFADITLGLKYYIPAGRFTFIPQLYSRNLFGKQVEFAYCNLVGGEIMGRYHDYQLPFVGINHTTQTKMQTSIVRLDLRYRLYKKHYLTATGNYMRSAANLGTLISLDDEGIGNWGCGLKYSYNSPIGPISFGIHYSDLIDDFESYFSLGYVF